jgi:hypothetical protein
MQPLKIPGLFLSYTRIMRVKNPPPPQFFITHEYPALISLKRQGRLTIEENKKQKTILEQRRKREEMNEKRKKTRRKSTRDKGQVKMTRRYTVLCLLLFLPVNAPVFLLCHLCPSFILPVYSPGFCFHHFCSSLFLSVYSPGF